MLFLASDKRDLKCKVSRNWTRWKEEEKSESEGKKRVIGHFNGKSSDVRSD